MPTNRERFVAERRGGRGVSPAVRELLLTGHWRPFLAGRDECAPPDEVLERLWRKYRSEILERVEDPWALSYFEGDYRERLRDWKGWIRTEADEYAVEKYGCYFDLHAAMRVVTFFSRFLWHFEDQWAGRRFELLDWQKYEIVMPLYGWKRKDGTRRFRIGYIEIPKKNGKSALCSGLSDYHLIGEGDYGANVYCAAGEREQASIVFDYAVNIMRPSEALFSLLDVADSRKTIHYRRTNSKFKALSAEEKTKEGLKINALIFDELHVQRDYGLWKTLRYGGRSRRQPIMIAITTAGEERRGICWEQHETARQVLEGTRKELYYYFPYIRCADEKKLADDPEYWKKPEAWYAANPSLGITISEETIREDVMEAAKNPRAEIEFRQYTLNEWGQKLERWLPMEKWRKCEADRLKRNAMLQSLAGRECYAGIDLASRVDVAALVLDFFLDPDHVIVPFFWIPEENAREREKRDHVPYLAWAREGHIEMTPGNVIDYEFIRRRIHELAEMYTIQEIAFDPWNATQFSNQLQDDGFTMVEVKQGYPMMSEPCKDFEKHVIAGTLTHFGNPALTWMAGNTVVRTNARGDIMPDKERSSEKIDGIAAAVMAMGRAIRHVDEKIVYDGELVVV